MPWRPIQSVGRGFLNLLGLKSNGNMPELLGEQVQPVLDMHQWYLQDNAELVIAQGVLPTNSGAGYFVPCTNALVNSLVVPNGEVWFVHSYSGALRSLLDGGHLYGHVGGAIQERDGSSRYEWLTPMMTYGEQYSTTGTWDSGYLAGFATQPMRIFPGGTVFGITYGYADLGASGGDFECYLRVTKIKS